MGALYRDARCFVLGSFSDKWGVVVHEAAASGCLLLLSTAVGAHYDFARPENSALFDPASVEEFQQGFEKLMTMPEEKLDAAQAQIRHNRDGVDKRFVAIEQLKDIKQQLLAFQSALDELFPDIPAAK